MVLIVPVPGYCFCSTFGQEEMVLNVRCNI